MPVRKYRSAADMPPPPPRAPLDPENLKIFFGLWDFCHHLRPTRRTPGVRKFHSWDDLLRSREERPSGSARSAPASPAHAPDPAPDDRPRR